MKVIIDCNVFISAGLGSKNCIEVIRTVDKNTSLISHTSKNILTEFIEVAQRDKFLRYRKNLFQLLSLFVSISEKHDNSPLSPYILTDKKDQMYVDLASHIASDYLITGNTKHFPDSPYGKTEIVNPAEFLEKVT